MASNIRTGDIQEEQENLDMDDFQADARQIEEEDQVSYFDAVTEVDAINEVKQLAQDISDNDTFEHPMVFNDLSLCTLASCIKSDSQYDLLENIEQDQILEILIRIGNVEFTADSFHGKSEDELEKMMTSIKKLILDFVQSNCGCILL